MYRFIVVITGVFIFSSCSNKSKSNLEIFKATEEGFLQSNKAISNSSIVIYHALEEKLSKPESAQQASIWQPKAILIKEKSAEIINYLDSLVVELKKEAGIKLVDMREVYNEDDLDAVNRLFIKKNTGEQLYEKLKKYKNDMLAVDPEIKKVFGNNSIIISNRFEEGNSKDFTKAFFDHSPAIAAITMLRKFQNSVRVLENKLITFCYNKIGSTDGHGFFTKIGVIVAQNTTILKAGEEIEVMAGIGSFQNAVKAKVTFGNKVFESADIDGIAKYKFKTSLKAGKYSLPVKIEFIEVDGSRQSVEKKVEYTVVE